MSPRQVLDKRLESPLCVTVRARLRNWLSEVSYQEKKTLAPVCGHLMKANKRTNARTHAHTRSHCLLLPNNKNLLTYDFFSAPPLSKPLCVNRTKT